MKENEENERKTKGKRKGKENERKTKGKKGKRKETRGKAKDLSGLR